MSAADLLQRLRSDGFALNADGDRLIVRPASKLTDDLRTVLRAAKPELLALLAANDPATPAQDRPYRLSKADADRCHAEKFAGFADIRKPENGPQTRANACDSQNSQLSQGGMVKTCAGCLNRLRHGTCAEPQAAGLAQKFTIVWPPAGHAATCQAFTARAPTPPQDRPFRLSQADADRCHLGGWDDAEISMFVTRVALFMRRGISATAADDLSERLTLRDREQDDRRSCAECKHGRGTRCPDGSPLPIGLLHRCAAFASAGPSSGAP